MNKLIFCLVFFNLIFNSCENSRVGYRFSNFENSPAEKLAKAIKRNDIKRIREEVINKKVDINSTDDKFKCSLLSLSIVNDKKESFLELLKLGANPNQENPQCESPLILAIRLNSNCDLYYIKNLISYNADLTPGFFNKCNFAYDPILETILHYNEESKEKCGIEILNVLTKKLGEIDLDEFNNSKDYMHNIIYFCLKTGNLSALKFFIVDLESKAPQKVFIDSAVLLNAYGYMDLKEVLQHRSFVFKHSKYREDAKNQLLNYLNKN